MAELRIAFEIKRRVYEDPSRAPKDIYEELSKLGAKTSLSTVSTYRTDFLNSLTVLREIGALPPLPKAQAAKAAKLKANNKTVEPKPEAALAVAEAAAAAEPALA